MNRYGLRPFLLTVSFLFFLYISCIYGQNPIRILAIGNSFSEDAAESYVDDLAKADGVKLIIANLYWGGCSLETHWNNAKTNNKGYSYRKIVNGDTTVLDKKSIFYAVKDEKWDYITFQQVSQYSGRYKTFFPYITNLLQYVKGNATNKDVKYALHRTWAYAANSTHSDYDYYHKNQIEMFDSIVNTYNKVSVQTGINIIIPSGTAIQNARTSSFGDNLNRDGYHLSYKLGRYIAACTWYEKLTGRLVIGNSFYPKGISKEEAKIAQTAAHYAITNPNHVTNMTTLRY
ncbi:MAG: DUF4886 domain-containing protein [Paludibacter sp.]|nr:DUF4886 domain-containing protein [Paludibacter sp.]